MPRVSTTTVPATGGSRNKRTTTYPRRRDLEAWESGEQNWNHRDNEQTADKQFSNVR